MSPFAFALTREQEWRFGDIIKVRGVNHDNTDARWMVVGYDGRQWTALIMTPNSPYLGLGTHWPTLEGFTLVDGE